MSRLGSRQRFPPLRAPYGSRNVRGSRPNVPPWQRNRWGAGRCYKGLSANMAGTGVICGAYLGAENVPVPLSSARLHQAIGNKPFLAVARLRLDCSGRSGKMGGTWQSVSLQLDPSRACFMLQASPAIPRAHRVGGTQIPCCVFDSNRDLARYVAQTVAGIIRRKNAAGSPAVLGLPTGSTPVGVYRELISTRTARKGSISRTSSLSISTNTTGCNQPSCKATTAGCTNTSSTT